MTEQPDPAKLPPWVPKAAGVVVLAVFGVLTVLWLLQRLRGLLSALVLALFLSFALEPAVQFLAKRGWRRGAATGLVFLVAFLAGVSFVAIMVPPFVRQAQSVVAAFPGYVEEVADSLERWLDVDVAVGEIDAGFTNLEGLLTRYGGGFASSVLGIGSALAGVVVTGLTVALFTFYLVADGPRLRRVVFAVFRPERQRELQRIWEIAISRTGGYVYSRTLLAAASAAVTWVALRIIGVPNALALAIWVGVISQFVPAVGTYLAGVVPLVTAFFHEPSAAFWVLIVIVVYQQLENYIVAPRVTARTMSLHPAVAFGAAIAGISILGALGAFIALPAAAIVQALISTYLEFHPVIETEEPVRTRNRNG
jgi:predicted PurR-regulated permease PerM